MQYSLCFVLRVCVFTEQCMMHLPCWVHCKKTIVNPGLHSLKISVRSKVDRSHLVLKRFSETVGGQCNGHISGDTRSI